MNGALDLRDHKAAPVLAMPCNIEAEQALIGCLLGDNGVFERLPETLTPETFFDPVHRLIFDGIEANVRKGRLADPVLINDAFKGQVGYEEMGGLSYLMDLWDHAPPGANAPEYARSIVDASLRREILRISGEAANEARSPARDARDQLEAMEAALYALAEPGGRRGSGGFIAFADSLAGAIQQAAEAYSRDGGLSGLSTGLKDVDAKLGGLHPSDLIIIAGRPSMGKSALAANIAFNVARRYTWEKDQDGRQKTVSGGVVAFFSLEMSAEQLAMRIAADVSGVPSDRIRKGEVDAAEFGQLRDAAMEIQESPLYIDDTGGLSLGKLCARARRLKRTHGLDLLVVDYLQLITTDGGGRNDNRVQEVSQITMGLKALAKELNVPVIALSQLSRQVEQREDKRPLLSDLRESGSIEQDADVVVFVYREEYYLERTKPDENDGAKFLPWVEKFDACRGLAEFIIGKARHGPVGTVKLAFNSSLTRFGDLAPSHLRVVR